MTRLPLPARLLEALRAVPPARWRTLFLATLVVVLGVSAVQHVAKTQKLSRLGTQTKTAFLRWRVQILGEETPGRGPIPGLKHGDDVYRLVGTSLSKRHDPVFLAVARSFQPLPPEALSGIEEQHLRLATAEPDESFAALSRRTRNQWDVQQTAVMNGLYADQPLAGGQLLKIALAERYEPRKEETE